MLKKLGRILYIIFIAVNAFIWAALIICAAPLLLIATGVLAFISARRTPVSDKPQG